MLRKNRTVKAYIELGQAAITARQGNLYRLWLVVRAWDMTGRGVVSISELATLTAGMWSKQSLKRHLKSGAGVWWRLDSFGRVWLRGLDAIVEHYAIPIAAHPVYIPLDNLQSLADFSAACLASMMAGKDRTIGRSTLARLYGRGSRTISTYTKKASAAGILTSTKQAAITEQPVGLAYLPDVAAQGYFIARVKGARVLAKHLPNLYSSKLATAAYGKVKTIARKSSLIPTGATYRKLYFDINSKQLTRALHGLAQGENLYIQGAGATDDGRRLLYMYEGGLNGEALLI